MQKSVFVAADLSAKHLELLQAAVKQALLKGKASPQDSLLLIPLPEEYARLSMAIGGANNILAAIEAIPLKIIL